MSTPVNEPAAPPAQEPTPPQAGTPAEPTPAEATDWKAEARKWETRAKENGTKAKELERLQQASMSDAEKATAEAEQRGRSTAAAEFGQRLARTEFDAAAGRRNKDFDAASALEYVDLSKFVGDDGEPDKKAISQAVERLVPAAPDGPPSFDGGPRTPPPAQTGMTDLIRKATGRA